MGQQRRSFTSEFKQEAVGGMKLAQTTWETSWQDTQSWTGIILEN